MSSESSESRASRPRRRTSTRNSETTVAGSASPSSSAPPPLPPAQPAQPSEPTELGQRRRGRRRKLPVMTNSERARYYRERNAATRAETEAAVEELQRDVDSLEIQEEMYRQLVHLDVPPTTRANIVRLLVDFITDRLDTLLLTLQNSRHELERVEVTGDALAPIVRVDCSLRGHLTPSTTHQIYPHVIGNSVLLDRMMHDQVDLTCSCWFYFTPDGTLEHHTVEVNAVNGLRVLLGDLHTVGRVLSNVRIDRVTVYPNREEIGRHASALSLAELDLE